MTSCSCQNTLINVLFGNILSFYQYKNNKSGHILHTEPLIQEQRNGWFSKQRAWSQSSRSFQPSQQALSRHRCTAITFHFHQSNKVYTRGFQPNKGEIHQGDECSGSRLDSPLPPFKKLVRPETLLPFSESMQAQRQPKPTSTLVRWWGEGRSPREIALTSGRGVTFQTSFS